MDLSRLFRVLVVGGALAAVGSCDGKSSEPLPISRMPDAPNASDAVTTDADRDGNPEDIQCFCNNEACCDRSDPGTPALQEGFFCCWGTTC